MTRARLIEILTEQIEAYEYKFAISEYSIERAADQILAELKQERARS